MPDSEQNAAELFSPAVEELVALEAAIACNGTACWGQHFRAALEHGATRADVAQAMAVARRVKERCAEHTLKVAGEQLAAAREPGPASGGCCCAKRQQ